MKKLYATLTSVCLLLSLSLTAQPPVQWQKTYGGSNNESSSCIRQTTDGGYIFAGGTSSSNGDVISNHATPNGAVWIVKTNVKGNIQWSKALGGSGGEAARTIEQTFDGDIS